MLKNVFYRSIFRTKILTALCYLLDPHEYKDKECQKNNQSYNKRPHVKGDYCQGIQPADIVAEIQRTIAGSAERSVLKVLYPRQNRIGRLGAVVHVKYAEYCPLVVVFSNGVNIRPAAIMHLRSGTVLDTDMM